MLPARLAALGPLSLFGWLISGTGAILLALVFAQLSMMVSRGGGPHVYIEKAFGRKTAFFAAWTYWLISWIGSISIIITAVGYLTPVLGISSPLLYLLLEIAIITSVTCINIRGTALAGSVEIFLTIIKCLPLIIIPLMGVLFFQDHHSDLFAVRSLSLFTTLNSASLITFWGFIGIETATTTAAIVENPRRTIPRAVILGTLIVTSIYFFNSWGVMSIVPLQTLAQSHAPYVDATQLVFGPGWNMVIAVIAFVACIGTLNAWVLTSGQIALEAAKNQLFPSFFTKRTQSGSPYLCLLVSFACIVLILCSTLTPNVLSLLNVIIDVSVVTFVLIYLSCTIAYLKTIVLDPKKSYFYGAVALFAAVFCTWILLFVSLKTLFYCAILPLSGIPIYLWNKKRIDQSLFSTTQTASLHSGNTSL